MNHNASDPRTVHVSGPADPGHVATITAVEEDFWACHCGNTPHADGFAPINRDGIDVDPTPEQWPEPLYMCHRCGLVMDADTVDTNAHTVAVIGRITL